MILINKRKGISPVISTIILAGMVFMVGTMVWSYTFGASTWAAENYVNDTLSLVDYVTERFIVEHITTNSSTGALKVWIYNYGDLTITADVYVNTTDGNLGETRKTVIDPLESKMIEVVCTDPLEIGDYLVVKIVSWRQNYVSENFMVE
jgi:flagellin-like protein